MIKVTDSINDKNLFKAIFMAGGPGSGKSYVAKNMFGFDDFNVSFSDAMLVNSDVLFEIGLEKANLPLVINVNDKNMYQQQMMIRDRAKQLTKSRQALWVNSMLPLVIDGTGKDFEKIKKQSDVLRSIGYDTAMVFVNTSLETALQRNAMRARSVDPDLVEQMWSEVQSNMGKFQSYFGNNDFYIIDCNNSFAKNSKEELKFKTDLYKIGLKLLSEPLKNKIGIANIEYLRANGGKYLSDLSSELNEDFKKHDAEFTYQLLSRLKSDCDYCLSYGSPRQLWGKTIDEHIAAMKFYWNDLKVKPEWLSMEDILNYEAALRKKYPNG